MFEYAFGMAIRGAFSFGIIGLLGAIAMAYYWEGFGDGFYLLLFFWAPDII